MHFRVGPGQESVVGVIKIDFDEQRSRSSIDRVGSARQLPREPLARKLSQGDLRRGLARFDALRIFLWHIHVDTQCTGLGNMKKIGSRRATAARIDKVPDISVARRDYAVEGGVNLLE